MLILTGPTAAGKNTIGSIIANRLQRCAVIDFDSVRKMFFNPHKTPWDGEEGKKQQLLGVAMVCSLAKRFFEDGWEVVVLDVVNNETGKVYRKLLSEYKLQIVQLLPSYEVIKDRFDKRGPVLTEEELRHVYTEQQEFTGYDNRIDNSSLAAENTADQILQLMTIRK